MRLFVYDMLVNINVIYYEHVCETVRWARSAGNSAIENLCIIIIIYQNTPTVRACRISAKASQLKMYMQQIDYLFSVLSLFEFIVSKLIETEENKLT